MGIDGLLNLLKPVVQKQHLSSFRGKRVAIDAKMWLYKGCYGYTFQLNQQLKTNEFMYYVFQMIQLLTYYQIDILLVFDGRSLNMKADTNQKRRKNKQDNYQKGLKSLENEDFLEAQKYFARCIKIDQRIFSTALNCFRTKKVKFMIAPYQADSQIAKLYHLGQVDYVISEDSDFLVYGCRVLLKLTPTGECDYIDLDKVNKQLYKDNLPLYNFLDLSYLDKINACVLAGCDYLSNIKGIGLRTAVGLLKKYKTVPDTISQLRKNKKMEGKIVDKYQQLVVKAQMIFLLAKVYNTKSNNLQYLQKSNDYNSLNLSKQQLDLIVGEDYQYTQDVLKGNVDCNKFIRRSIQTINVKTLFEMEHKNMKLQQLRFRLFKKQNVKNEFTEQEIEEAKLLEERNRVQRQAREKKKNQQKQIRKNEINKFINSLMYLADEVEQQQANIKQKDAIKNQINQQEEDSDGQLSLQNLIGQQEPQNLNPNVRVSTKQYKPTVQENESDSEGLYYQNLNPFMIKK